MLFDAHRAFVSGLFQSEFDCFGICNQFFGRRLVKSIYSFFNHGFFVLIAQLLAVDFRWRHDKVYHTMRMPAVG